MISQDIREKYMNSCIREVCSKYEKGETRINVFLDAKLEGAVLAVAVADKLDQEESLAREKSDYTYKEEEYSNCICFVAGNEHSWQQLRHTAESSYPHRLKRRFLLEEELLSSEGKSLISSLDKAAAIIMLEVGSQGRRFVDQYINAQPKCRSLSIAYVGTTEQSQETMTLVEEVPRKTAPPWAYEELVLKHEFEELPLGSKHLQKEFKKSIRATKLYDLAPYVIYNLSEISDIRDFASASFLEKESLMTLIVNRVKKVRGHLSLVAENLYRVNSWDYLLALEEKYNELKELCEFQSKLLAAIGINEDMVNDSFKLIKLKRLELENQLTSPDEETVEAARTQLADAVSQQIVELTKKVMTISNKEEIEASLERVLSSQVWHNRLCEESRSYLFTAEANYQLMIARKDKAQLDYSGICLLLCKTLEKEMYRRFYEEYRNYLLTKFPPGNYSYLYNWPQGLKYKDKNGKCVELAADYFTLGSVMSAIGVHYDKQTGAYSQHYHDFPRFKAYALGRFYPVGMSEAELEKIAIDIAVIAKKVAEDYRNPAAHRNGINHVKAEECREYMLLVQHKLKAILENMLK